MPAFATSNLATSDFTVKYLTDLSLIGEYVVTLRSSICVPTDYTGKTCTTLGDQYSFSIYVDPCVVNTYTATTKVTLISYNIGDATFQGGKYFFDEDPVCNYPETVTLTNLPTFVTHNTPSSDFTIPKTNNLSLLG